MRLKSLLSIPVSPMDGFSSMCESTVAAATCYLLPLVPDFGSERHGVFEGAPVAESVRIQRSSSDAGYLPGELNSNESSYGEGIWKGRVYRR